MKKLFLLVVGLLLLGTLDARAQFVPGTLAWANKAVGAAITNDFTVPKSGSAWPTAPAPGNFTVALTVTGVNPDPTITWPGNNGIGGQGLMIPGSPTILVTGANGQAIRSGSQVPAGVYTVYFWNTGSATQRQIIDPGPPGPGNSWDTYYHTFRISQGQVVGSGTVATVGWRTRRQNPQQQGTQQQQAQTQAQRWWSTKSESVPRSSTAECGDWHPNQRSPHSHYT